MLCRFIIPFASGLVTATLVSIVVVGRAASIAATLMGRLISYLPSHGRKM
jgi:hypothetical protein